MSFLPFCFVIFRVLCYTMEYDAEGETVMANTREEAWELLKEYNKEPFHLQHGLTVEGCLRYFARELGYGDQEDFWGMVGLLHDLDYEKYPEEHCRKARS